MTKVKVTLGASEVDLSYERSLLGVRVNFTSGHLIAIVLSKIVWVNFKSSEPLSKRHEEGFLQAKNDPKTGVYLM